MDKQEKMLMTFGVLLLLFLTIILTLFGAYKIIAQYHDFTYAVLSVFVALGVTAAAYFLILQIHTEES
jgi:hypothetical protein